MGNQESCRMGKLGHVEKGAKSQKKELQYIDLEEFVGHSAIKQNEAINSKIWKKKEPTFSYKLENGQPLPSSVFQAQPAYNPLPAERSSISSRASPRIPVSQQNLKKLPYSSIGLLQFTFKEGGNHFFGSGVLIGKKYVLTCGHNCCNQFGQDAFSMHFYLGVTRNSGKRIKVTRMYFPTQLRKKYTADNDYAILLLEHNADSIFGSPTIDFTQPVLQGSSVEVVGFPFQFKYQGQDYGKNMATSTGKVQGISRVRNFIDYSIKTSQGQSGCPIMAQINGEKCVIGIHLGQKKGSVEKFGIYLSENHVQLLMKFFAAFDQEQQPQKVIKYSRISTIKTRSQKCAAQLRDKLQEKKKQFKESQEKWVKNFNKISPKWDIQIAGLMSRINEQNMERMIYKQQQMAELKLMRIYEFQKLEEKWVALDQQIQQWSNEIDLMTEIEEEKYLELEERWDLLKYGMGVRFDELDILKKRWDQLDGYIEDWIKDIDYYILHPDNSN